MRATFFLISLLTLEAVTSLKNKNEVWKDGMFKIPDLKTICATFKKAQDVSPKCLKHLDLVCHNFTLFLTMYAASPRFPFPGLGYASYVAFGNYEQCLKIDVLNNGSRFLGEYCRLSLFIPISFENITNKTDFFRLSVCRPYGCSDDDYNNILLVKMNPKFPIVYHDEICDTIEDYEGKFTTIDIITMGLFGIFFLLILTSTSYDVYMYKKQLKNTQPLLTSFSFLSNGRKLLHISKHTKSKEHIEVFQGFRVIGMMWIVAGHAMMNWEKVPIINVRIKDAVSWPFLLSSWYILTAPLAVDTFFYISGFLLAFHYLKYKEKSLREHVASVPYLYIHRYLRLTPPLLMIYLVVISVFRYWGNGPDWFMNRSFAEICEKYWWSFFLYLQNYVNYEDTCLPQTWFLSTDFQLYLLAPLVLIPVCLTLKKPSGLSKCLWWMLLFNIFCVCMPLAIRLRYRDYTNTYGTHSKLIDYFSGAMLAIFMRERIDKPFLYMIKEHHRSVVNLVAWVVVLLGMLSITICFQDQEVKDVYVNLSVFYSMMKPTWCIGLSWITYSCYHGYGGFVNWILCRPIFQILGRLTYCIYLLHQTVVDFHFLTRKGPWHFSDYDAFYFFCGHYVISLFLAIFWTLAFESPFIILENCLFGTSKSVKGTTGSTEFTLKAESADCCQNGINGELSLKCATQEVYKVTTDDC